MRSQIALLLLVPLVTSVSLVVNSASATSAGETCQGLPATIVSDGESVTGTPGPDVIVLNTVNQTTAGLTVRSGAGNDSVCLTGQNSQVEVVLGDGDDSLLVDDTPTARPVTVKADLGVGSDTVVSGRGFDSVTSGDATSAALDGPDDVSTGEGDDEYVAGSPLGVVDLGKGDDRINIVAGDSGQPVRMGPGDDTIAFINAEERPTATIDAGPGRDRFEVAGNNVFVNLRKERASVNGSEFFTLLGVQDARFDVEFSTFVGDGLPNLVEVKGCESTLKGGRGDDIFRHFDGIMDAPPNPCFHAVPQRWFGNQGDDRLIGPMGRQEFFGGPGNDKLSVREDQRLVGNGLSRLSGGGGDDVLLGGPKRDTIFGSNGNDVLRGGQNDDKLYGGAGRDKAVGGSGRDGCVAEVRRSCER